jgi:hypothetical protein
MLIPTELISEVPETDPEIKDRHREMVDPEEPTEDLLLGDSEIETTEPKTDHPGLTMLTHAKEVDHLIEKDSSHQLGDILTHPYVLIAEKIEKNARKQKRERFSAI